MAHETVTPVPRWVPEDGDPTRCPGCGVEPHEEHRPNCPQVTEAPAAEPWEPLVGSAEDIRPWQVEGFWRYPSLVLVHGLPGAYKSLFALHVANCVAQGNPLGGRDVQQGRVVYVAAESPGQHPGRQLGWERTFGDGRQTEGLLWRREPVDLLEDGEAGGLLSGGELARRIAEDNMTRGDVDPITLVLFDSLHASMPGGSDTSDRDLGQVISRARELTEESGCTVFLVHHSNIRDERERGHGSLWAALDTRLHAKKTRDGLKLKCTKQRNGREGWSVNFVPREVDLGDGERTVVLDVPEDDLDDKDVAILDAVAGGATTQREIADSTEIGLGTVNRRLRQLADRGDLERRDGRFLLPDEDDG